MRSDNPTHEEFLKATMGYMDFVYNIARRVAVSVEDAEDLVQETYFAAFRAWQDDRRPDKVEPWIATICLNLSRSMFRKRSVRPSEVSLEDRHLELPGSSDPEREALAALDSDSLHLAIGQLSEEQSVALTLVDLGGLSTAEAAAVMGTPRGTVLSRLHRGRRALALLLDNDVPEREVN